MNQEAYCEGARGYIVGKLQRALGKGLKADNDYGRKTSAAVRELQTEKGLPVTGNADARVFSALNLGFPGKFERCLCLTDAFEGTGFGGINKRDIDGAGVTLGIVGFTTKHGEVQRLVSEYLRMRPSALNNLPVSAKGKLLALTRASGRNQEAWDRWFYGNDGIVDSWIRDVVAGWGNDDLFQRLQMAIIENEMWLPTFRTARSMGLENNLAALALLFDTQVQNGGWSERHQKDYVALSHDGSLRSKLQAMAQSITACASSQWRRDVGLRKMVFVTGGGEVHGHYFDLQDYAFGDAWSAK